MKSPNIQASLSNSFAQSTVSSGRFNSAAYYQNKPMTPIAPKRQFDYSKSYVYENARAKREEPALRRTINYDEPMTPTPNRAKLQGFLRNTSYFSIEQDRPINLSRRLDKSEYAKPNLDKDSWNINETTYAENKANNVEKILQKIQKKQKLINELKQLSKFNITEQIKISPADPTLRNSDKNTINRSIRNSVEVKQEYSYEPIKNKNQKQDIFNTSKIISTVPKDSKNDFKVSPNNINQKTEPKLYESIKLSQLTTKNKNPQEEAGKQVDFKRAKNSYFTPKQAHSNPNGEEKASSKLLLSKMQSLREVEKKGGDQLYRSCKYNSNDILHQIKTPLPRMEEFKSIQDIRLLSEFKINKNSMNSNSKKFSIYDFDLVKPLGQGKFGSVFQAIHKATNSIYAIKKISKKVIKSNLMVDQLLKQIKIQSYCQHENILQLYGFFDDIEYIYLILEYMEEGTLFAELKKRKCFTEDQASIKLKQVAKAIIYLHQNGIAHRDIKPENIVMSHGVGKLCDFGWATFCGNDRRKTYCGTFDYAAPEILQGSQYDLTVDLWCLGVLAYELLVGKAPFYHYSRKQTMKKILNVEKQSIVYPNQLSKEAISFIDSLIRKNPEQRMTGTDILNHPFILMAGQQEQE